MASKPGRNDPCRCGSGKKYKKCCLASDEAAPPAPRLGARSLPGGRPPALPGALRAAPPATLAGPAPALPAPGNEPTEARQRNELTEAQQRNELTEAQQWWEAWADEQREEEDLAVLLPRLEEALREGKDVADEFLIEYAEPALIALKKAGRHAEVISLIERLEARFPRSFGESRGSFELERFESAVELPGVDLAAEARRLGPHAHDLAESVDGLPTRMAWEGHPDAALALAESAWESASDKGDASWAREGWLLKVIELRVLAHLERDPGLAADDPALLASLAPLVGEGRALDQIRTHAMVWLALLRPAGDEVIVQPDLLKLGKREADAGIRQASRLAARAAARLRERAGWTRGQSWVLLREMGPLLDECARAASDKKGKATASSLLLPPPSLLLATLNSRNRDLFNDRRHEVAAVTLALPAWAGAVADEGCASDKQAHDWQQQVMGESHRDWSSVGERGALARRVIAFTEREGRQREALLR